MAVVLISGDFMGIRGGVGGTGIAAAMTATKDPGNGSEYDPVQAAAGTFADEAVKSRVGNTVQSGQQ